MGGGDSREQLPHTPWLRWVPSKLWNRHVFVWFDWAENRIMDTCIYTYASPHTCTHTHLQTDAWGLFGLS